MPASSPSVSLNRRQFLRGAGVLMGLPTLEAFAQTSTALVAPPVRLAFLYSPNGRNMSHWTPQGQGRDWQLSPTLEAFAALKNDITLITGLDCEPAKAHGDGPGDHSRAAAAFLTGVHPYKTSGNDIRVGQSADQIAAQALGALTRLPSLELGTDSIRPAGRCDAGYACAYQYNFSWRNATTPAPPETSPRAVFERLFGGNAAGSSEQQLKRLATRRSVLDFVREQARKLESRLPASDRATLSGYLESVREVERRMEKQEAFAASNQAQVRSTAQEPPPDSGIGSFQEHLRLMFEMLALAFQTDSTRIATFLMAAEASGKIFPALGINDGHHTLSHHQGNEKTLAQLAQIDRWYADEVARFLLRLKDTTDASGASLLDTSMIVYGCGIADGNDHGHDNLPLLLAGRGGGLQPGQHLVLEGAVPATNLCRSLLHRMGVETAHFGDSTGMLKGI